MEIDTELEYEWQDGVLHMRWKLPGKEWSEWSEVTHKMTMTISVGNSAPEYRLVRTGG